MSSLVPDPTSSRPAPSIPAAQLLARVESFSNGDIIHLPERFARAAVERLLEVYGVAGTLLEGPHTAGLPGLRLGAGQWAVVVPTAAGARMGLIPRPGSVRVDTRTAFVNPYPTLFIEHRKASHLLAALEHVKPLELDERGLPLPWVPPRPKVTDAHALDHGDREDDARPLLPGEALPPPPEATPAGPHFIDDATIGRWFKTLCERASLTPPELTLTRGHDDRLGLVTGRVWYRVGGAPLRVHLTTCPNSDLAEILATLAHELAHPLAHAATGSRAHDLPMKRAMVDLAARQWGERWFTAARARLDAPIRTLDYWVATCIRAALKDGEVPAPKQADDGQMARVFGKLKKLRELAHNQAGRPEGIAATAAANDLVTLYDLGSYGVGLGDIDEDQLVDRWVGLEDGAVWRRMLAHGVATHFGVFSLAVSATHRMHFFGAYADVVAAEYLYSVSAARITRECEDHLRQWKRKRGKTTAAETRTEKTSFCDCAVIEFRKKLARIAAEEGRDEERPLEASEEFARVEHDKRGRGWASAKKKLYRENAAGRAVGRAMEVLHGVSGSSEAPAALGHKR